MVGGLACSPRSGTRPPIVEASPEASSEVSTTHAEVPDEGTPRPSAEVEPEAGAELASDRPAIEVPTVAGQWRPPLPAISLEPLDEDEQRRGDECMQTHRIADPDTNPLELMAGARCLRDARSFGKEIAIYRLVLSKAPEQPSAMEAMRSMALRFEQMDQRAMALDGLEGYLQRYPREEDARAVGERAVCLARSVEDPRREEELLATLDRYFRRRGFERPAPEDLPALCGEGAGQ